MNRLFRRRRSRGPRQKWYKVQFDHGWVMCKNANCRETYTYAHAFGKRKCPACGINSRGEVMPAKGKHIPADGHEEWYSRGKLHRKDGPAIVRPDGTRGFFISGKKYAVKDFCAEVGMTDEETMLTVLKWGTYEEWT